MPIARKVAAALTTAREVYLFGGLLVAVVACLLLLNAAGMDALSGVRAYATGEGLWSKRQKEAVASLTRYAASHDERDFAEYLRALEVPLGDRQARIELERAAPDLELARLGFLRGRNHPDDIPKMIRLFRRFRSVHYVSEAIEIWRQGDLWIERLTSLGGELHAQVASGQPRPDDIAHLVRQIAEVDRQLTPLEDAFSQTLGLAARQAQGALLLLLGSVGGLLLAICIPLSVRTLREARTSEETLRDSERRFRALIENSTDAIALMDTQGRILYASATTSRVLGYALEDFVGRNAYEFVHADDAALLAAGLTQVLEQPGRTASVCAHVRRKDGELRFLEGVLTNLVHDPAIRAIVVNYRDITERKQSEDALRSSEERYRSLFERNLAGVFRSTLEGRLVDCNKAFAHIFGYDTRDEALSRPAHEFYLDPKDRQAYVARLQEARALVDYEGRHRRRDGTAVWTLENVSLLDGPEGPLIEGTLIDISERKRAQEQIEYQAYHDALTGLPNRVLLKDRLTQALAHARRQQGALVLMFLDLDRFKLVNDSLGHSVGDKLLNAVAARLVGSVREGDTVARVGGDEFTLLFPGMVREDDSARMARKVLDVVAEPVQLEGQEFYVTTSIGIALYPDDGQDAESLLKSADSAMYRAKELGRNGYQHWTQGMNARALERMALEGRLRRAMDRGEFRLHYQPIVDLETGSVPRVEALVRWQDPERGLLNAGAFVPTAEESGLIVTLGEWVLRTAARQLVAWQRTTCPGLKIAVNLSARQFEQRSLPQAIHDILDETGLAPEHLELEITESIAARDVEWTTDALLRLRARGTSISLDDFGTGQSSLSYLRHFPLNGLKIDRSFVRDLGRGSENEAIVRAVIALAHSLKLRVVAEGVETEEQMTFLRDAGCEELQGFLFGHAVPAADLPALVESLSSSLGRRSP